MQALQFVDNAVPSALGLDRNLSLHSRSGNDKVRLNTDNDKARLKTEYRKIRKGQKLVSPKRMRLQFECPQQQQHVWVCGNMSAA